MTMPSYVNNDVTNAKPLTVTVKSTATKLDLVTIPTTPAKPWDSTIQLSKQ